MLWKHPSAWRWPECALTKAKRHGTDGTRRATSVVGPTQITGVETQQPASDASLKPDTKRKSGFPLSGGGDDVGSTQRRWRRMGLHRRPPRSPRPFDGQGTCQRPHHIDVARCRGLHLGCPARLPVSGRYPPKGCVQGSEPIRREHRLRRLQGQCKRFRPVQHTGVNLDPVGSNIRSRATILGISED